MDIDIEYHKINVKLGYFESLKSLYRIGNKVRGSIVAYGSKETLKRRIEYVRNLLHSYGYSITKYSKIKFSRIMSMYKIRIFFEKQL